MGDAEGRRENGKVVRDGKTWEDNERIKEGVKNRGKRKEKRLRKEELRVRSERVKI